MTRPDTKERPDVDLLEPGVASARGLVTVQDIARRYRASPRTVYRWTLRRSFPDPVARMRKPGFTKHPFLWDWSEVEEHVSGWWA